MMSHHKTRVTVIKDPAKCFCEHVSRVDNSRDVFHDNVTKDAPVLQGKISDLDVARTFRRNIMVDNFLSRFIVFIDFSWISLWVREIIEDKTKILSRLGRGIGSYQF